MLPLLAAVVCTHTPNHFLSTTCGQLGHHLHEVNVSQVNYIHVDPKCNITFTVNETCNINKISLHRFTPDHESDAFVLVQTASGNTHLFAEDKNVKEAEPFTTTQYVTTIERDNFVTNSPSCTITIGASSKAKLSFVVGKAEEWWLFLTIPYFAPRIQWGWAFASMSQWYWPYIVYAVAYGGGGYLLATKYKTSDKRSFTVVALLIACSFLIDFVLPVSLVVQNLGYYWPRSALWNVFIIFKLLLYVEFIYLYLNIEDRAGWPYLDTLKLKLWTLFGMVPYTNGPAKNRTWFAPVSIQPRLYLADLFIWLCQVAVLCALFAFHIGLCMPLLFIVILFRNYDYNVGLLDKPDDRTALQAQQSNKTMANWLRIIGAILTLVTMFFFIWLIPMYFACRLQETLPARTLRLVMRQPKKQVKKQGNTYVSLKRV